MWNTKFKLFLQKVAIGEIMVLSDPLYMLNPFKFADEGPSNCFHFSQAINQLFPAYPLLQNILWWTWMVTIAWGPHQDVRAFYNPPFSCSMNQFLPAWTLSHKIFSVNIMYYMSHTISELHKDAKRILAIGKNKNYYVATSLLICHWKSYSRRCYEYDHQH